MSALSLLAFSLPSGGEARGDGGGDDLMPRQANKNWQRECGSCHLAYPPSLLPKASWRRVMAGLDAHFGENASLEPTIQADILRFLETHAADSGSSRMGDRVMRRGAPDAAPLRITETRWFVREHHDVSRTTWTRTSIGSAANCAACHRQAERGVFEEDTVNIPR